MPKRKKTVITSAPSSKNICFVIMPFGDWADFYYENIFRPAIDAAGLTPRRADDLYRPSAIVHDIWDLTQTAQLLLADLTGKNPNVFYELGLAHALAKPVILVAEQMDDVPFDLRSLRVITYDKNDPSWGGILKEKITTSTKEVLAAPRDAVLPSFLAVKGAHEKTTVTVAEKEILTLRQDIEMLKREVVSRGPVYPRRPVTREELEARITDFHRRGYPEGLIHRRVAEIYGLPTQIVEEALREIQRRTEGPSLFEHQPPTEPPTQEKKSEQPPAQQ